MKDGRDMLSRLRPALVVVLVSALLASTMTETNAATPPEPSTPTADVTVTARTDEESPVTAVADEATAIATAKRQKAPVQVTSKTTQSQTVHAQPDGSLLLKADAQPTRIQTDSGWTNIDTALTRSGAWLRPKVPGNRVLISTATRPGSPLASVTVPRSQLPSLAAGQTSSQAATTVQVGWRPNKSRRTRTRR